VGGFYYFLCALLSVTSVSAQVPTVAVLNGTYSGYHLQIWDQDVFLGMPYAQHAGGANRFRVPQPLNETWDDVRSATRYSDQCPDDSPPKPDAPYGMSENCLSLNIVRPSARKANASTLLPVMVWIHGGSYQRGTTGLPNYNLTYLVNRSQEIGRPVLGVSINYRKGGWGNMYSIEIAGSGNTNLALRDMRQALAWLQENVEAFGGDKTCVTVWGESSGSFAVGQLLLTYGGRSDGLFHRSIQESGSAATAWYNGTEWYQPIYDSIVSTRTATDVSVHTYALDRSIKSTVLKQRTLLSACEQFHTRICCPISIHLRSLGPDFIQLWTETLYLATQLSCCVMGA
jgi:carboxylesterase type B